WAGSSAGPEGRLRWQHWPLNWLTSALSTRSRGHADGSRYVDRLLKSPRIPPTNTRRRSKRREALWQRPMLSSRGCWQQTKLPLQRSVEIDSDDLHQRPARGGGVHDQLGEH